MTNFITVIFLLFSVQNLYSNDIFNDYHTQKKLDLLAQNLNSPYLFKSVLATSSTGKKIHLFKLSSSTTPRPAILLVGDTNPGSPVGSEILLRWLQELIKNEEKLKALTSQNDIYIIPRPFPEPISTFFSSMKYENKLNSSPNDSDNDLAQDEDGYDDLNGDGFITLLRIEDDNGKFIESPESSLLLIPAKHDSPKKFTVFSEGIDNDRDGKFNEDLIGSVNPNKNFSFNYPYFQKDAGIHQMCEIETRALADFIFQHPEIFLVFSFDEFDNLKNPWKEDGQKTKTKFRSTIYKEDEWIFEKYSKFAEENLKLPKFHRQNQNPTGNFSHWIYYHCGKIPLTTIPWQIPIEEIEEKVSPEAKEILWLQKNSPEALISWQKVTHPDFSIDFPDKVVEVGGIKPFYLTVPPIPAIEKLIPKYDLFFSSILTFTPKINVSKFTLTKLDNNLSRLEITVKNFGNAPLNSTVAIKSNKGFPLNLRLNLPENWQVYQGKSRQQIDNLQPAEEKQLTWLILTKETTEKISLDFSCPQIINFIYQLEQK